MKIRALWNFLALLAATACFATALWWVWAPLGLAGEAAALVFWVAVFGDAKKGCATCAREADANTEASA